MLGAAAVAVVIVSWRVPEPEQSSPNPAQRVLPISYTQCAKQDSPPPNYGTRGLVNTTCMQ